jgi:hypothetical protein
MHRSICHRERKKPGIRRSIALPRKVHINGLEWRWELTGSKIKILSPAQEFWMIDLSSFTGMSWDEIERGK